MEVTFRADSAFPLRVGPSLIHHLPLDTAKSAECDRSDTEKGCYQVVAEEAFMARKLFAEPCKAVSTAKRGKAPFSISLAGQFLLQNTVCPFANWLRCQHEFSQSAAVHLRNERVCNHFY